MHKMLLTKMCVICTIGGMRLDEWMTKHGTDDAAFAALVGTDRTTISRVRRGKQWPSRELARQIAANTGNAVTLGELASADEPKSPEASDDSSASHPSDEAA